MCERGQSETGCRCQAGRMRGLVQPRLLLQLARKPAHGYELMDALDEGAGGQAPDPGTLYRTLRGWKRMDWYVQRGIPRAPVRRAACTSCPIKGSSSCTPGP